jgi:hydroxymethylpyrimidine pyrophosphatase-like HAD family hydrolase
MAYILESDVPNGTPVWLFSASGGNQDILAAYELAEAERVRGVEIVTSGSDGALAKAALAGNANGFSPSLHIAPAADPKDGFLATHSAVSAAVRLLMASDAVLGSQVAESRRARLVAGVEQILHPERRGKLRGATLAAFGDCDTLVLLHDPRLAAAAVLVETSFWEAGVASVQRTDFRNFAHGRHVWFARHPGRTFVLSMTCDRSREAWMAIANALPVGIPRADFDFGRAGRGGLFEAVLTALTIVEAAGALKGVDPGKPGVAEFGRRMFGGSDLRAIVATDDSAIRRKRRAERRTDPSDASPVDWVAARSSFLESLAAADIRAVVLDYDGTVVSTADRLKPPRPDLQALLRSLLESGLALGFASGRGGSLGKALREQIPEEHHGKVVVGYYNGAHIVALEVDIEKVVPGFDASVAAFYERLGAVAGLFVDGWLPKQGALQITIPFDKLVDAAEGVERIMSLAADETGQRPTVRVSRSGHSIDVFPVWAAKTRVLDEIRRRIGDPTADILTVGDSGDSQGNDHELLFGGLGLSVGSVCHRYDSCWNFLPADIKGPEGLTRVLRSLRPDLKGGAKIDVPFLFSF